MDIKIVNNGFNFLSNIDYPMFAIRKAFGKTQSEIAEITDIPQQTLSRLEAYKKLNDRYIIYLVTVYAICCNVYRDIEPTATKILKLKAGEK